MTVTISFRVSEELEEFLEQEAEERMTTKSTVAQMLLAERVRQVKNETGGSDESKDAQEPASTVFLGEPGEFQFASKTEADAFRDEYSQFVDTDRDDKRMSYVAVIAETPAQLGEEAAMEGAEHQDTSEDGE